MSEEHTTLDLLREGGCDERRGEAGSLSEGRAEAVPTREAGGGAAC